MKIEIDLDDILGDENGVETLQESVRRQVLDKLTSKIREGIEKQINQQTAIVINEQLREALMDRMPRIVDDLMNAEYEPVDRWGERTKGKTTLRSELVKQIQEHMVYKKADYSSQKNAFTQAVDSTLDEKMKEFKSAFIKTVDEKFMADSLNYAANRLAERAGIKLAGGR